MERSSLDEKAQIIELKLELQTNSNLFYPIHIKLCWVLKMIDKKIH